MPKKIKYDIIKTRDKNIIKFLLPLTNIIIKKNKLEYTKEDFYEWLEKHIEEDNFHLWIYIKETEGNKLLNEKNKREIIGYIVIGILEYLKSEQIFIYHIISIDKDKKIAQDLYETVINFGKKKGIKCISAIIARHTKAMCKIFGAKVEGTLITREI